MRLMTFAAVLAFVGLTAMAEEAAAQLKIAVLNTDLAIGQSEEFKVFNAALEEEFADEQAQLQKLQEEIAALQKREADERDVMSQTELAEVQKEKGDKEIDIEFLGRKFQKELNDRQTEFFQKMTPKLRAVVNDLIEIERYDLVYDRRTLLFANMKHDITAKVTEKLNERYAEQQEEADG